MITPWRHAIWLLPLLEKCTAGFSTLGPMMSMCATQCFSDLMAVQPTREQNVRVHNPWTSQGDSAVWDARPGLVLDSGLAGSRSSATPVSTVRSFWDFARSTTVILPCSGQDFGAVRRRSDRLWVDGALIAGFGFGMCFGRVSHIAQGPRIRAAVTTTDEYLMA